MIGKILLFHREGICYNVVNTVSDELAAAFERAGIKTAFFDITPWLSKEPDEEALRPVLNGGYDAVLAVNAVGQEAYTYDNRNIYDIMDVPFYNYILDHPFVHHVDLKRGPKKYRVICMDRHHADFIKRCFPNIEKAYFQPLGGIGADPAELLFEDFTAREYGLVYTGTRMRLDEMEKQIAEYPPAIRRLSLSCIEYMLDNRGLSPEEALENVLGSMGIREIPGEDFLNYSVVTAIANRYLCAYVREEAVRYLLASDAAVDIFGNGWEDIAEEAGSNAVFHEAVDYRKTAEIYKRSKLVLNVMPFFRDGSHDRIPTALMCGAGVISDHSAYLDETMNDKIFFFDIEKPGELPERVKNIMSDERALFERVKAGKAYADKNMSYDSVVRNLTADGVFNV
ncbi:MAG: hypothetical protein K6B44_05415 [Lachnospiraceae bacterium]|nr:hypothetical protein [Lachnospiraceae bacterium]